MARLRRIGAVTAIALGLGALGVHARSSHAARALPPTQVFGVDFLLKSQIDTNFCMEVQNGTTPGRKITLQVCGGADQQRFVFTRYANNTNTIVENQGMCVDGHDHQATHYSPIPVRKCVESTAWHWTFLSTGQIKNAMNGECLWVPGAASNAAVHLDPCKATDKRDLWQLAKG